MRTTLFNRWFLVALAMLSGASALGLLLVSGWFIAASAVAGMLVTGTVFNYVIPAATIRLLAMIRIATGYATNYFGHEQLLEKLNFLRISLFEKVLRSSSLTPHSSELEKLERHTQAHANFGLAVFVPRMTALIITVVVTLFFIVFVRPHIDLLLIILVTLGALYLYRNRKTLQAVTQLQKQHAAYRETLNQHLLSASLWSLTADDTIAAVQAHWQRTWQAFQRIQYQTEALLLTVSLGALFIALLILPVELLGSPLLLLLPLLLLTIPDWLGEVFRSNSKAAEARLANQYLTEIPQEPQLDAAQPTNLSQTTTPSNDQNTAQLKLSNFQWQRNHRIGTPVNAVIEQGDIVSIQGDSGSGKTSLLLALAGLLPFTGSLHCSLATHSIYYAEQQPSVLSDSLRNNLLIANPSADEAALVAALEFAQLSHLNSHLDQWVGECGRSLSGGERKRLGLARAWLSNKKFWLLDEPFEGINAHTTAALASGLSAIVDQQIILLVSHRPVPALQFTQTIFISNDSS